MIIKQLPVSERPREKMLAMGTRALSNRELLAVLLGSGSKERSALVIADELLQMDSRGLRSLADCPDKRHRPGKGFDPDGGHRTGQKDR